jgi:hypothetical protein
VTGFVPVEGGRWSGLLFDHPRVGLAPALTWTFQIPLAEVDGAATALEVDWLPLDGAGWRTMAGHAALSESFAEPAEPSVYRRGHHRFERVALRVTDQDGPRIRVAATIGGDIDGLGTDEISVAAWLRFDGIIVQLGGVGSAAGALARLTAVTDAAGLTEVPDPGGLNYRFAPGNSVSGRRRGGR